MGFQAENSWNKGMDHVGSLTKEERKYRNQR